MSATAEDTVSRARDALRKGRFSEAERLYRLVIEHALHPGAATERTPEEQKLHRLAINTARAEFGAALLFRLARLEDASSVLQPLIREEDGAIWLPAIAHLAEARRGLGFAREAIVLAHKASEGSPQDFDARLVLARTLLDLRQRRDSLANFQRAIRINPARAEGYAGLARALAEMNDLKSCEDAIAEARARNPNDPDAQRAAAALLAKRGDFHAAAGASNEAARRLLGAGYRLEAQIAFERAAKLAPDVPAYLNDAGVCAYLRRRPADATAWLERAVSLKPDFAQALSNLGAALMETAALERAHACLQRSIDIEPDNHEAHVNLANVLLELRRHAEAERHYRIALARQPQMSAARQGLGIALLAQERFPEALEFCDARPAGAWAESLGLPLWRGEKDAPPSHLIVMSEQGLGDTLQFLGAVRDARSRFPRVGFVCPPPLTRLVAQNFPGVEVLRALPADLGEADRYVNLLSLAAMLAPENALTRRCGPFAPWIKAEPTEIETWRQRLDAVLEESDPAAPKQRLPRIGLCWGGGDALRDDRLRSIALGTFAPLLRMRHFHWISLQVGSKRAQISTLAKDLRPLDLADHMGDFADTAALVHHLDLVISVDTAVAHLAGAMGKPVWLLNRHASEWRWGLNRTDCDYYPSMRIFNQPAPLDWDSVIREMFEELAEHGPIRLAACSG